MILHHFVSILTSLLTCSDGSHVLVHHHVEVLSLGVMHLRSSWWVERSTQRIRHCMLLTTLCAVSALKPLKLLSLILWLNSPLLWLDLRRTCWTSQTLILQLRVRIWFIGHLLLGLLFTNCIFVESVCRHTHVLVLWGRLLKACTSWSRIIWLNLLHLHMIYHYLVGKLDVHRWLYQRSCIADSLLHVVVLGGLLLLFSSSHHRFF